MTLPVEGVLYALLKIGGGGVFVVKTFYYNLKRSIFVT